MTRQLNIFFFLLLIQSSFGQGFRSRFSLPNCSNHSSQAIFEISANYYISAGMAVDTSAGMVTNRLVMMGLDSAGKVKWEKRYGVNALSYYDNQFVSKYFNKIGNFIYYAGAAQDTGTRIIGVLIKFDLSGDTIWQRIYRNDDPNEDLIPQGVTNSVDNGLLITGLWQHWSLNISRCMLIKTDKNGNELWRKKISKPDPDVQDGKLILQDSASKKVVIAGYQYVGPSIKDNMLILDSVGTFISRHIYTTIGGWPTDLIQTSDKKFVVTGRSVQAETVGGTNLNQPFVAKFDINSPLIPIWTFKKLGISAEYNFFHSVVELPNSNLILGGVYDSAHMNNESSNILARLTAVDKDGKLLRNHCYDYRASGSDAVNATVLLMISPLEKGGFVGAIDVNSFSNSNPYFFVKFDTSGCDSTLDYCATISNVGLSDFFEETNNFKIYPNPATDYLVIGVSRTLKKMQLSYSIYNCLGSLKREDELILDDFGTVDISQLDQGVYNLTLKLPEGYSITKKFVIAR